MSDTTLTFNEKEFRTLKYLLCGVSNSDKLLEQMTPEFKESLETIKSGVDLDPKDIDDLQEAINYLSYLDHHKYIVDSNGKWKDRKVFLTSMLKSKVNIFAELAEFVFLPSKKRLGYTFDSTTREELADVAAEQGFYLPTVINHYFKLLAKGGSWNQKSRIQKYLKMNQVKDNKKLILILAKSKHRGVQFAAIEHASKSLYGFMVSDIKDEVAAWYLEKKMGNHNWRPKVNPGYGDVSKYAVEAEYIKETGKQLKHSY